MAYTGVVDIPRARVVKQPKSLGFNFFSVLGTEASVACAKVAAAQTVRGQVMPPVVHLAQPTGSVYRVGRRVLAQTSDTTAIMVAPEWEFTRVSPPAARYWGSSSTIVRCTVNWNRGAQRAAVAGLSASSCWRCPVPRKRV